MLIVYCLLVFTLIVAFASLWLTRRSGRHNWQLVVLSVSIAAFIYLYGVWVFASVYAKYVFGLIFVVALALALVRKAETQVRTSGKGRVVSVLFSCVFIILCPLYFTGTAGKPYGVIKLALPFKSGTYFVFQGGSGLPTNVFHYFGRKTLFAMDIIKLNKAGNRATRIFSKRLEDYAIFADTIFSPCDGVILKTESGNPDNIPPARKRGPTNLNQVIIETKSAYIFLGHLKMGCVFVHQGEPVKTGQPLGLAGNSGMSLEPHLHIQAHAKTNSKEPWYKQPQLQIQFNGKSYLLFEEIAAGK